MKYSEEKVISLIKDIFNNKELVKAIFSDMKGDYPFTKVIVKPVVIKNIFMFQFEEFQNNKAFHSNLNMDEGINKIFDLVKNFKQYVIFSTKSDYQIIKGKKDFNVKETSNEKCCVSLEHNKTKKYIIEDGVPVPFLIKLGLMGEDGKVFKNSYDKFRQINI